MCGTPHPPLPVNLHLAVVRFRGSAIAKWIRLQNGFDCLGFLTKIKKSHNDKPRATRGIEKAVNLLLSDEGSSQALGTVDLASNFREQTNQLDESVNGFGWGYDGIGVEVIREAAETLA